MDAQHRVIIGLHRKQFRTTIRELRVSADFARPKPKVTKEFQLGILNKAEIEFLERIPRFQREDQAQGVNFEVAEYQLAFVALTLRWKKRLYRRSKLYPVSQEVRRELKLTVTLENIDKATRSIQGFLNPLDGVRGLNALESDTFRLMDRTLEKLAEDIKKIDSVINEWGLELATLNRRAPKKPSLFSRGPDPREVYQHKSDQMALSRAIQEQRDAKEKIQALLLTEGQKKELKRLAVLDFIAESKLRALHLLPELLASELR
jgi:hypothetical protein